MSLSIWKDFRFAAAHSVGSLPDGHKCRNVHGHNYKVRVRVSAPIDIATGLCGGVDFDRIKAAWSEIEPALDHKNINDVLGANATAEHLSIYIFSQMKLRVPNVDRVWVWESDSCGAEFGT